MNIRMILVAALAGLCATAHAQDTNAAVRGAPGAETNAGRDRTFSTFLSPGPSASTNGAGMTITSDRTEFDYKEFVVAFDGHVHVVDPQFAMDSDRMFVFLEGTNQLKRIVAIGHVDMQQTDRHATCDKAVYERDSGKVVMTGNPVLSRGNDRAKGRVITIWLSDQRVIMENGQMNISLESMKNRNVKP